FPKGVRLANPFGQVSPEGIIAGMPARLFFERKHMDRILEVRRGRHHLGMLHRQISERLTKTFARTDRFIPRLEVWKRQRRTRFSQLQEFLASLLPSFGVLRVDPLFFSGGNPVLP